MTTTHVGLRFDDIEDVKSWLSVMGYVTLKAKSYRAAQERQRIAEALMRYAEKDAKNNRAWAVNCLDDSRLVRDRLTFVYGVARAHGATIEDLTGKP